MMRRAVIVLALFVLAISLAHAADAGTPLVVLGPAADARLAAGVADKAKASLEPVAPIGGKQIDTTCAADSACLIAAGAELGAQRVVAVALTPKGGKIAVAMMLVDVESKELISKRDVAIAEARLAKELPAAVRKLVDTGPVERAKDLFGQANRHFNLGEYAPALELYKRAYRVKALPAFLFNIAQCHRKLGQHKEAVAMYQSYLVGVPDAENKTLVESLIAESRAALAEEQRIADARAAEAAKVELERIAADKKKSDDARKVKEAEARERRKTEEARIRAQRERELDAQYNRHPTRKFALAGGTIGAAGMIAGGVFALLARQAQSRYDDAGCGIRDHTIDETEKADCIADADKGAKHARLANLLLASGGGVLAASLVVFVIDPGNVERPEQARASIHISPTSIGSAISSRLLRGPAMPGLAIKAVVRW
jgi:tetratricopeptide (TPR) repeat protein